jgi:DNA repair exonuclease SbcCD ATPase subunit
MPPRDPTFWELVVEAFHRKPPSRRLGAVPWNKIALAAVAILGVGNPGFWLAGVAGELIYLYAAATSPRFRNLIRAKRLESERTTADQQIEKWLAELAGEGQRRYQALADNCRQVQRVYETLRPGGLSVIDEQRWKGLDQLLFLFLRLQVSLDMLQRQMGGVSPHELQREVEALRAEVAQLAESSEALKRSKQSLLELKEKRLENLGRAAEARQVLASELQRIEQQVELLREEAAFSRNAESLSAKIDSVAGILSENDSWMRQHEEILSDLGVESGPTPRLLERTEAPPQATRQP